MEYLKCIVSIQGRQIGQFKSKRTFNMVMDFPSIVQHSTTQNNCRTILQKGIQITEYQMIAPEAAHEYYEPIKKQFMSGTNY